MGIFGGHYFAIHNLLSDPQRFPFQTLLFKLCFQSHSSLFMKDSMCLKLGTRFPHYTVTEFAFCHFMFMEDCISTCFVSQKKSEGDFPFHDMVIASWLCL